ncbi:MAG: exopolysaccharide biosynthesis protein [Planctomycetales bacterium]|nr:exopolysaccharide biosynthesis protein [Planctomycetales bacterium]
MGTKSENEAAKLTSLVDDMVEQTEGDQASVGDLLQAISTRSFGPLLIVPALITISPIGAIPGVPAVVGLVIMLLAGQILVGQRHPWLPQWLLALSFDRDRLVKAQGRLKSLLSSAATFFKPRLQALVSPTAERVVAVCCIALALTYFPLGLVPFGVALPGIAICLLGLGLTTRDGLLTAGGLIASLAVMGGVVATFFS